MKPAGRRQLKELGRSFCFAMSMTVFVWHGAEGVALLCGMPSFGFMALVCTMMPIQMSLLLLFKLSFLGKLTGKLQLDNCELVVSTFETAMPQLCTV